MRLQLAAQTVTQYGSEAHFSIALKTVHGLRVGKTAAKGPDPRAIARSSGLKC